MPSSAPPRSAFVWLAALGAACLAAVALQNAVRWYDHPVGGILVTSDLEVSGVGMPTWDGSAQGLSYPDRILAIDDVDLSRVEGPAGAARWDRAVDDAVAQRAVTVHVRVRTSSGERELDLRIDRIAPPMWWLYGGGTIFTGVLYVVAALTALTASPRGALARAFAKFALLAAVYLFGFLDAHTSRALVPIFHFAFGWGPLALVALALRLPDDAPIARRFPAIFGIVDFIGVSVGLLLAWRVFVGESTAALRAAWTVVFGCSTLLFVVLFVARFIAATGSRRDILRVLLRATAAPYALIGMGVLVSMLSPRSTAAAFLALPALALAPLATGVASARNNLWGSRALLSRVATLAVSGGLACAVAAGIGSAFAAGFGIPFRDALAGAAAGAVASGPLVYMALRAVERTLFPAVAGYKPTIEQLSEDLESVSSPGEVTAAVERTVRRWLACDRVELVACGDGGADAMPPPVEGHDDELSIPASFGGRTLGVLRVGGKRGGARFTTEDVDLLSAIANHAALALAYARSYAELEQRRRQQAAAWQVERLALIETLAAEVAHEVRYPINFFRSIFQRAPDGAKLARDEIEVGCEEVERLERLVSGLRRLVAGRVERRAVSLADLAVHTEVLLRDMLGARALDVDIPPHVALCCDPDQVRQVLVNLVSNALEASGARGRVGIVWEDTEAGGALVVWDDGPGFEGAASELFVPWFTTKPQGTGLGLAITQRIVRAHNWTVDVLRSAKTTRFVVSIPLADIVGRSTARDLAEVLP